MLKTRSEIFSQSLNQILFFTVLQAIKRKHAADVSRIIDSMWVLTVNNLFISAKMGNIQIRETYFVAFIGAIATGGYEPIKSKSHDLLFL